MLLTIDEPGSKTVILETVFNQNLCFQPLLISSLSTAIAFSIAAYPVVGNMQLPDYFDIQKMAFFKHFGIYLIFSLQFWLHI